MDTRLPAGVLLLALVVTVGAFALVPGASADGGAGSTNATTVSVSAGASATAAPDRAVVSVAVVRENDTADGAREALAAAVAELRAELDAAGVSDVNTTAYSLRPDYRYTDGEREPRGYVASQAFEIEAPDVDQAGVVIDAAVAGGANRIDGVQFTLTDQRRQQLRTDALGDAVDRARADADALVSAAGLTVSGVDSISTSSGFQPVYYAAERASDAGTVVDPGPVSVSVSVSVTYLAD